MFLFHFVFFFCIWTQFIQLWNIKFDWNQRRRRTRFMLTSDQLTEESRLLLWKWRFLGRFSSLISASRSSVMLAAPSFTRRTFVSVQTFVFLRRWILTSSDVSFGATRTTEPVKHLPSNVVLTGAAAATSFTFLFLYWNISTTIGWVVVKSVSMTMNCNNGLSSSSISWSETDQYCDC